MARHLLFLPRWQDPGAGMCGQGGIGITRWSAGGSTASLLVAQLLQQLLVVGVWQTPSDTVLQPVRAGAQKKPSALFSVVAANNLSRSANASKMQKCSFYPYTGRLW